MIDLGQKKNCLNCSYFTLMLNTVNRGSTGKLLTTAEGKIKPFMPAKKCLPRLFLFSIALNIHVIYYLCLTELMCPFLWYVPSYSRYVFCFFFCFFFKPAFLSHLFISLTLFRLSLAPIPALRSLLQLADLPRPQRAPPSLGSRHGVTNLHSH